MTDENYDKLSINFNDEDSYSLTISGDSKKKIKISSQNSIIKYNSEKNAYDISTTQFNHMVNIDNNIMQKSDINELTFQSIDITYDEFKAELILAGIDISKIESLSKKKV